MWLSSRLLLAVAMPLLACALQWLLWDAFIQPYAWFLFFPAALGSAWLGGWRGGLVGTGLGAVLAWSVFIAPGLPDRHPGLSSVLSVVVFVVTGLLFARLFERARQAQHHRAARAEAIFERAPVGIAELGLDGRWRQVNDRFCEILGYPRAELLALGPGVITHPDELAPDQALRERMLNGNVPTLTRDRRFLRKDGSTGWLCLTINLVCQPDGAPDYFISVIEDISARRHAEVAQADSDRRYRELVQSVNSAIIHWMPDGRIVFANEFSIQLFGWPAEALIGQPVGMLVPERDSTGVDLSGLVADIAAHPNRFESTLNENVRRDGRRLWMTWTNRALLDEQGRVTGILAVGNDVTEARRAEAALREREQRVRFALETSRIGTWEVDVQACTAQHSPLVDLIFGYREPLPQWNGEVFLQHVHPEDRAHVAERFQAAVAQRSNWDFQCRIRRADGAWRWIWVAGRCSGGDDTGPLRLVGILQDITERKQAEIELQRQTLEVRRRNEELERFNRASVGRELRMIELKRHINQLDSELGRESEYDLSFLADEGAGAGGGEQP